MGFGFELALRFCSDLCAGLIGGLGVTPSGNVGMDGAIFESVSALFVLCEHIATFDDATTQTSKLSRGGLETPESNLHPSLCSPCLGSGQD